MSIKNLARGYLPNWAQAILSTKPASAKADPPVGTLTFKLFGRYDYDDGENSPILCDKSLWDTDYSYRSDGTMSMACNIKRPKYIGLSRAPSALTIRFVIPVNPADGCWPGDKPVKLLIVMKTTKAITTIPELKLNTILQAASTPGAGHGDGVVAPGLRTISIYKSADIGAGFDYANNLVGITTRRSGE